MRPSASCVLLNKRTAKTSANKNQKAPLADSYTVGKNTSFILCKQQGSWGLSSSSFRALKQVRMTKEGKGEKEGMNHLKSSFMRNSSPTHSDEPPLC